MNLYRINVKHLAEKGKHESIETFIVSENESDLYDKMCSFTYWNEKDENFCRRYIDNFEKLLGSEDIDSETYNKKLDEIIKNFIISTKGEIDSVWANYNDLYYGCTHYGWELLKENITDGEITLLISLKILK